MQSISRFYTPITLLLFTLLGLNVLKNITIVNTSYSFIEQNDPPITITEGWQYRWGDSPYDEANIPEWSQTPLDDSAWTPLAKPGFPPDEPRQNYIWLRTSLPQGNWQDPALYIPLATETFEVYSGSQRIYKFGEIGTYEQGFPYGWAWHIIPLPPNYQQHPLAFRIYAPANNTRILREVVLGHSNNHIRQMVRADLPALTIILCLFILGFFAFFLYVKNRHEPIYGAFVVVTAAIGTTLFVNTQIKQFILDSPTFWQPIRIVSSYAILLGLALFLEQLWSGQNQWLFRRIRQLWLGIVLFTGFVTVNNTPLPFSYPPIVSIIAIFTLLLFVIVVILLAFKGLYEARVIGIGLAMMMGTFAFLIASIFLGRQAWEPIVWVGIFSFILSLSYVLVKRFTAVYAQTEKYAQQLEIQNQSLQTYQDRLETLVDERTAELSHTLTHLQETQAQLLHAKNAAEVANEAKSEFLSNMSHELRTPLNGILGYAQIFQRDHTLNRKHKEGIQVIQQSGQHLLTLINDILDLAKIEARKLDLTPQESNLHQFLAGLEGLMQMQAQQKNLQFNYHVEGELPAIVMVDEKRLRQILINLLSNAIKFTHTGNVALTVTRLPTPTEAANKAYLHFKVTDTGVGMAPEHLEKIFTPFEQVGDHEGRAQGTGLGLAISQHLIQAMGGRIEVASVLNEGSSFSFKLLLPIVANTIEKWATIETRPLTWQYPPSSLTETTPPLTDETTPPMQLPPMDHVQELYTLAEIGDMVSLIKALTALSEQDASLRPFVQKLHHLAQDYNDEAIIQILEPYVREPS